MKAIVLAEPVLVGRERELEELSRCLDFAIEGKGTTVFLSGEAGSGKTRLTNEFLTALREKDVVVLSGYCLSDVAVPYLPFVEAFDAYYAERNREQEEESPSRSKDQVGMNLLSIEQTEDEDLDVKSWLRGPREFERTGRSESLSPEAWKDKAFAAVTKALISISLSKPTVLFLEDVHWADSASLSLLHYISRAIRASRVLVLATFRNEELSPDEDGRPHKLVETLRLMKREDLCTEIQLPNLNQTYVSRVAEAMIGGTVHPEFAAKLASESHGNPLFIVESLRMLSERGHLFQEDSLWRLSVDAVGIPEKLRDIILHRLSALKLDQRRVLDAASVIGEKFDVELLGTVLGQDSLEVLETLNAVGQSTSLVRVEEDFFRFDHAKSREAIYGEIPLPLKKGYHARVAERLEGKGGPLQFSDISYHYAQAGNKEKAVKYALVAGEDALARYSNSEAINHFSYVLHTLPNIQENLGKRLVALEGLGDAYYVNGLFTMAIEAFERLADASGGRAKLRAYRKAMDAVYFGDIGQARMAELVRKAEPYAASDRLDSARIRFYRLSSKDPHVVSKIGEDVEALLQVFEEEYSLPDIARLLEAVGSIDSAVRSSERGLSMGLLATTLCEELGDIRDLIRATIFVGTDFNWVGLLQEAQDMFAKVIQIGEKMGDYNRIAGASWYFGRLLDIMGRFEEALSWTLKCVEYREKTDSLIEKEFSYAQLMRQYARVGNLEAAEEYHKKLMESLSETKPRPQESFSQVEAPDSLAVFNAAKCRWIESDRYFEEAFRGAKETGLRIIEVTIHADYAWALERQGRTKEADTQRREVQRFFAEVDEKFSHVRLEARLLAPWKVVSGEEFEMRLWLVNISRKPCSQVEVKSLVPSEFEVVSPPMTGRFKDGSFKMEDRSLGPFEVETVKLKLKASKTGTFTLSPKVFYADELGITKTCEPKPITITAQQAKPKHEVLPGRISTGLEELDTLLFGGIPEKQAVVLASPSTDEKELLVKRFLEAGAKAGEITFHITTEAENTNAIAEKYPMSFHLFLCNPQADSMIQNMSNASKLKGVENLTDIDIAIVKVFQTLDSSRTGPKRICIDVVSDILLQHHAVTTRRWLSALLPTLKSKGFTTLATINPKMHLQEEFEAILGVFDGEIRVSEKETPKGTSQTLKVRKLGKQKYLENELILNKEKMEQQ